MLVHRRFVNRPKGLTPGSKSHFNSVIAILISEKEFVNILVFLRYKLVLGDDLVSVIDPIRLKIEDYLKNRDYIETVLRNGRDWATQSAEKTMDDVRKRIGVKVLWNSDVKYLFRAFQTHENLLWFCCTLTCLSQLLKTE